MITSIKLVRFKRFRGVEVPLRPFCVLTGENNSGKTTVLQGIWLALHGLHQGRLLDVDRATLLARVSANGCYLPDVPFLQQDDIPALFYDRVSRGSQTYDEKSGALLTVSDERGNCYRLHLRELFKNLNMKLLTPAGELYCPKLHEQEPLYLSGYGEITGREERLYPASLDARVSGGNSGGALRNVVLDLKLRSPEKYRMLTRIMEKEFGFRIRELHFHESREQYVFSEYQEEGGREGVSLEFANCGSGILHILGILAVILHHCPEKTKVVLIDEPEAHLHGKLQGKFASALWKLQQKLGIQIILATVSDAFYKDLPQENVIRMEALKETEEQEEISGAEGAAGPQDGAQRRDRRAGYEQLSFTDL